MVWALMTIGIIALFGILVWALGEFFDAKKKSQPEQQHIDQVREAAFAVILASLEAEPEKWEPTYGDKGDVIGLFLEKEMAIYLYGGPSRLYILADKKAAEQITPPKAMQAAIYTAAMKIVRGEAEAKEMKRLEDMVDIFSRRIHKEENHDTQAA